jgi:molybdopterin-guanine dinucleotide biosynthesis protein A
MASQTVCLPNLSVAVLAGGQSRRMGADKALLRIGEDEPPLISRVIERISAISPDIKIIGNGRRSYDQFGIPVVEDRFGDAGALGGLATALDSANTSRVLVVSCDMPFLSVSLIQWMSAMHSRYDVLVPTTSTSMSGKSQTVYQPLHAIYDRSCLQVVANALARGERALHSFYSDVLVLEVTTAWARAFDPGLWTFFSVNTREDLMTARKRVVGRLPTNNPQIVDWRRNSK